ncbi:MAG TPA: hypothetical protein PKK06_09720 [Phycisphaerae bacterium]|nr:hypothetical protein [Phycisphaerae bacterium]HNU45578.1 hypothetical protein [Phycisphaerae bacterium]
MLTVTTPALERLSRRLVRKGAADDVALRFTRRQGGWKLGLDHECTGDTAFSHDGRKVLLLDEAVSSAMTHLTLDTQTGDRRSRLRLRRSVRPQD